MGQLVLRKLGMMDQYHPAALDSRPQGQKSEFLLRGRSDLQSRRGAQTLGHPLVVLVAGSWSPGSKAGLEGIDLWKSISLLSQSL